ncbi:MAG: sensor domain-containing diguanylate cyclase [Sulfuricurvum sp.]|jgi:diguanylate cyclase (GGDEF)-like protein|uniref:GGDEF domain-containing protein n=1 Tax=Sulfuricurvum sp. TaxID=2025608 RepID=UPI0025F59ED0|nr:sensor domain-containing diguanylate cyclase [Sulfuricurvum sp.]MCI4407060.1 sensor domain-containing diguanylate cyclase [Sulfuricurvum sp.]
MFKTEAYLDAIELAIDDFCIDFDRDKYIKEFHCDYAHTISEHKTLFISLFGSKTAAESEERTDEFVHFCVTNDIPYMFVYGELLTISRNLMRLFAQEGDVENIKRLSIYFDTLEHQITIAYFHKFLRRLAVKNHIRLSHLSNLVEKNLMIHYQQHIEWMIKLIDFVQHLDDAYPYPELNHTLCSFGKWLHDASIPYIITTSHFKEVGLLHQNLHDLASDVIAQTKGGVMKPKNLIHLMHRIDYISLEIGNEIAILNDMVMIEEYSKDPLTGLLTRRLFEKVIQSQIEIAKATESQCSLMMCDLDHFKLINDTYGHLAGDAVIQHFAESLRTLLRKSDFIFRFGGEEFIIILPSTNETNTRKIAQKLCDFTAEQEITFDGKPIRYTVSVGITPISIDSTSYILKETINRYVAEADAKLYLAKQNGRNRVE